MTTVDECLEGTSARTRPLSFDDIMQRRKNKVAAADKQVPDGPGVSDIASAGEKVKKARRSSESDKKIKDGSVPKDSRNNSEKLSVRRKKDASPSKNEKIIQDRDKRSRHPEASSKLISDNNVKSDRFISNKNERHHHGCRDRDGTHVDNIDYKFDTRQDRDSTKNDMVSLRPRVKSEIIREKPDIGDESHLDRKRKTDERKVTVLENSSEIRNTSDKTRPDRLSDRRRDRSEKESRQKRSYDDNKTKRSSTGKKLNLDKQVTDSKRAHVEESRSKRRRSRSGERDKGRGRRSPSHSPKPHKHTNVEESRSKRRRSRSEEHDKERGRRSPSHSMMQHKRSDKDKKEHGELSSRPSKSGTEHSDVGKNRISTNDSSSQKGNTVSSSGLGGYSPRKRRSETAVKSPSPTRLSPERRNAGWDLPPYGKENKIASSTLFNPSISNQNISLEIKELPSFSTVTRPLVKPVGIPYHTLTSKIHATESVQLTQATRPMRRLYAENLPTSASEKDLMECINNFLLSCGVNYINGTRPCISCIIHKENGQALLEFLTPEDASAALSFDGMFFSGSNLKLRRPKDYTHVTTGLNDDKSVVTVDTISDVVEDSPHKIFIGGVSKHISSQMLLEIAKAFGPVRAYYFKCTADSNEHCAFLEYVDHSVTSRACAGLSGMGLGGQVITAALATPHAVLMGNVGKPQFYGVPSQAKPLLAKPTTVLMLKNVLDPERLLSSSGSELEEILEDIRLECSRYGTVKSINVAKPDDNSICATEACEIKDINASSDCKAELDDKRYITEKLSKTISELGEHDRSEPSETLIQSENKTAEDKSGLNAISLSKNLVKDENNLAEDPSSKEDGGFQQVTSASESETNINSTKSVPPSNMKMVDKALIVEVKLEETNAETGNAAGLDCDENISTSGESGKRDVAIEFEPASVFVEFRRAEAACSAAHCLNGRVFDGRVVTVGYIDHDIYHIKFFK